MHSATLLLALAASASAFPKPNFGPWSYHAQNRNQCLGQGEAEQFLQAYIGAISKQRPDWKATAERIFSDANYKEVSNSITSIQGKFPLPPAPNVATTAPNKQSAISGLEHAPGGWNPHTRDIVVGCNKIVWHWIFTGIGSNQYPSTGFNLLHIERNNGGLQIGEVDIEFDNIAWGLDTGNAVIFPGGKQVGHAAPAAGPPGGGGRGRTQGGTGTGMGGGDVSQSLGQTGGSSDGG